MLARVPESEYCWPRRAGMWRAHQVATVPESQDTTAVEERRLPSSCATTWGFIGLSGRVARSSIRACHSFIPSCALPRKDRSSLRSRRGSRRRRVEVESPTRPTSTG